MNKETSVIEEAKEILQRKTLGGAGQYFFINNDARDLVEKLIAYAESLESTWINKPEVQVMIENLTYFDTMPDKYIALLEQGITKPTPP